LELLDFIYLGVERTREFIKNNIGFILVLFFSFSTGCTFYSKYPSEVEVKRLIECQKRWRYKDLDKDQEITVLLFQGKSNFDIYTYPNLIIGVTALNDTVGILDKDFSEPLISGDRITLTADNWSEREKEILKPLFTVHKNSIENDLFCKVSTVFYGKISKTKG